jgi:toxin-antitoxin system PIN domain toxin
MTMLLPDINVLLAGFRADHVHHDIARAFLEDARAGGDAMGLSDIALAGVVRLATNSRVFVRPDPTAAVLDYVEALLDAPGELVRTGPSHWTRFSELCREYQLRGNAVPDAYLAAVALEQRAELITFDRGFGRFRRLRWRCLLDG